MSRNKKSESSKRKLKWEIAAENAATRAVEESGLAKGADSDRKWDSVYDATLKRLSARHKAAAKRLNRIRAYRSRPLKTVGRSSMLGYD